MPQTGLFGPHQLNIQTIDSVVQGTGPGAYVLDRSDEEPFKIAYVGRSDSDLAGRLKSYVGGRYKWFKHGFFETAEQAFIKECKIYHDFNPPDNDVHPARPANTHWKCPWCNIYG